MNFINNNVCVRGFYESCVNSEPRENKSPSLFLPSFSQMSPGQLNLFPVDDWQQSRGLPEYNELLDTRTEKEIQLQVNTLFENTLKNLKENDIYLDIGAGNACAISDFRSRFPKGAKVIGVALHQPSLKYIDQIKKLDETDQKFSYYLSDFLDLPTSNLEGRVSVITDVISAFRYGRNPAKFMQQAGKLLKEGGLIFIRFHASDGVQAPVGYDRFLCNKGFGSAGLLRFWFLTIRGFDIVHLDKYVNGTRNDQQQIIEDVSKVGAQRIGKYVVVLRRNSDPVEADPLIIDPDADAKGLARSDVGKMIWDIWGPNYSWQISNYSRSLLVNPEIPQQIA